MIKKIGKALPYALAGAIAMNTFTGCGISKTVEEPTTIHEYHLDDLDISERIQPGESIYEDDDSRKLEIVDDVFIDLDEFERIKEEEDQTSIDHINRLYNYVRKYPIQLGELINELENVLMAKEVSLSEFDYYQYKLFLELKMIYPEKEGLVDFFYPLAKYMHEQYCSLEHTEEDGILHCPSIDERIDRLNETTLLNGVLVEEIEASDDEVLKDELKRIQTSCKEDEALTELENLYILSTVPQCLEGYELEELFPALLETVGERENIFEVYYDIALFRHLLLCDEEHTLNEYGRYECESAKKKVLGK